MCYREIFFEIKKTQSHQFSLFFSFFYTEGNTGAMVMILLLLMMQFMLTETSRHNRSHAVCMSSAATKPISTFIFFFRL